GDEIVVTALEHHANLAPWQVAARRSGARLLVLRPDAEGRLHADDLARLLGPRTRVFAVTACANATGERPPYQELLPPPPGAGAWWGARGGAGQGAGGARAAPPVVRLPGLLGPQDVRPDGHRGAGGAARRARTARAVAAGRRHGGVRDRDAGALRGPARAAG